MNRIDFGRLVASLRMDHGWKQVELAEYAEIDLPTLSNIERGTKKYLEPDLLFRLANVLQLTSLERREFFLAACGLEQAKIVRQPSAHTPTHVFDNEKLLDGLFSVIRDFQTPALIEDVYGDTVAVNNLFVAFWQIDQSYIEAGKSNPDMFNSLHFVYGNRQVTAPSLGEDWDEVAKELVRAFREGSLRYRTSQRYLEVVNSIRNGDNAFQFEKHWQAVSTVGSDKDITLDSIVVAHPRFGNLRVAASSLICMTPHSELFVTHYTPTDRHTAKAFISMQEEVGEGVVRVANWPEKKAV